MIHFVTGKPGGGKSLFAVGQIIEELRTSNRLIATNLRLRLDELEAHMQREYGENRAGSLAGEPWTARVRLLTDLEAKRFWLYPANGCDITERTQEGETNDKGVAQIDFPNWAQFPEVAERGVFWVVDEVHDHFGAREWQKTHRDGIYWASKHRHLRQDALLLTQHPELVDKNFRRLAQDFTVLRNFGNEPMLGFSLPKRFRRATYLNEKRPGDTQPPMQSGWFKMDMKVATCYYTHGTTGILSRTDVVESKGKGRSIWWLAVWVLAFVAALWFVPGMITGGISSVGKWMLTKKKDVVQSVTTVGADHPSEPTNVPPPVSVDSPPSATRVSSFQDPQKIDLTATNRVDLSRPKSIVVNRSGFVIVTLTNGVQLTTADGIELLGRDGFIYQGRVYPMP